MSSLSSAKQLMKYNSKDLLYAMSKKGPANKSFATPFRVEEEQNKVKELFNKATKEMAGTKLITVSLKEMRILNVHDIGRGEIYVITSIMDNSGQKEFKTPTFHGIKNGDYLPLGSGGMLVGMKSLDEAKDPGLFLDIHGVVMECDSDIRNLADRIKKAKEEAKFDEIEKIAKNLSTFDPTKLTSIMNGVSLFLDVLVAVMKQNKDDYVAQFHDFYLRQQAFGVGRHPKTGTYQFQDVELAYSIDMIQ